MQGVRMGLTTPILDLDLQWNVAIKITEWQDAQGILKYAQLYFPMMQESGGFQFL